MAGHSVMQKIQVIGFFFENELHWQYEVAGKILQTVILGYVLI